MWGECQWQLLQMGDLLPYGQWDDRRGSEVGSLPQRMDLRVLYELLSTTPRNGHSSSKSGSL